MTVREKNINDETIYAINRYMLDHNINRGVVADRLEMKINTYDITLHNLRCYKRLPSVSFLLKLEKLLNRNLICI